MGDTEYIAGLPPLIHAPIFAACYCVLACALGLRFLRVTRLESKQLTAVESGLLAVTLGVGLLQFLPLALSVLHLLSPASVRVSVLALAVLLVKDEWRVLKGSYSLLSKAVWGRVPPLLFAWALLVIALLLLVLPHTLVFGPFGDDDGYHLSAPARWLKAGTLAYLPTFTHTNAGLGFEMSYLIALAFGESTGAKLLHYCMGVFTLGAVVAVARRLGDWVAGITAVSLLLIDTRVVQVALLLSVAYVDFPACLSVVIGVLLWLAWRESKQRELLWSLALCAGLTASFKFTALSMVGVWLVVVAHELRTQRHSFRQAWPTLLRFGALAAVPVLPWLARNALVTGNPVYPLFASWIPSRDWTVEQGQVFGRYIRYFSWAIASGARLGEPSRQLILLGVATFVVVATGFFCWRIKEPASRTLLGVAGAFTLLCIGLTGLLLRYWLPGVICFTVVLCVAMSRAAAARVPQWSHIRYWPAIVFVAFALALQLRYEKLTGELFKHARMALGLPLLDREHDDASRMWAFIRSQTEPDARILAGAFYSTFGASSFGCFPANRQCFTTDSHLQTFIDLREWGAFLRSIRGAKIKYVLMSDRQFSPGRQGFSFLANENEYAFCQRLTRERGELLFRAHHLELFRLEVAGY